MKEKLEIKAAVADTNLKRRIDRMFTMQKVNSIQ